MKKWCMAALASLSMLMNHAAFADSAGKSLPKLASVSAAAMDAESGEMLLAKHANLQMPIASITKVMTAMVTLDANLDLEEAIRFSEQDRVAIDHYFSRIRNGSELPRGDVIRIALMSSENLAAASLARTYPGGSKAFIEAMNAKAVALGMRDTHFVDSSGLSTGNVSTAADLVRLVAAAADYPLLRDFSTTTVHTAHFSRPRYQLAYVNTNPLVRYERWPADVSKTGYLDQAGRCLVMKTEVDGRQVVMVMLDSFGKRSPIGDAGRIKRWLETGDGGAVASSAWNYQRNKLAGYLSKQPTASLN